MRSEISTRALRYPSHHEPPSCFRRVLAALRLRHRSCHRRPERESERAREGKSRRCIAGGGAEKESEEDRNATRDTQLKEKDKCER